MRWTHFPFFYAVSLLCVYGLAYPLGNYIPRSDVLVDHSILSQSTDSLILPRSQSRPSTSKAKGKQKETHAPEANLERPEPSTSKDKGKKKELPTPKDDQPFTSKAKGKQKETHTPGSHLEKPESSTSKDKGKKKELPTPKDDKPSTSKAKGKQKALSTPEDEKPSTPKVKIPTSILRKAGYRQQTIAKLGLPKSFFKGQAADHIVELQAVTYMIAHHLKTSPSKVCTDLLKVPLNSNKNLAMVGTGINLSKGISTKALLNGRPTTHFTAEVREYILEHQDAMKEVATDVDRVLASKECGKQKGGVHEHVEQMIQAANAPTSKAGPRRSNRVKNKSLPKLSPSLPKLSPLKKTSVKHQNHAGTSHSKDHLPSRKKTPVDGDDGTPPKQVQAPKTPERKDNARHSKRLKGQDPSPLKGNSVDDQNHAGTSQSKDHPVPVDDGLAEWEDADDTPPKQAPAPRTPERKDNSRRSKRLKGQDPSPLKENLVKDQNHAGTSHSEPATGQESDHASPSHSRASSPSRKQSVDDQNHAGTSQSEDHPIPVDDGLEEWEDADDPPPKRARRTRKGKGKQT